jgi:excisionase family DNA binding protein
MQIFKKAEDNGSREIPFRIQHGPKEAATLLGISERKLYQLINAGRLKSYRLDGKRFVSRTTLEHFVAELEVMV